MAMSLGTNMEIKWTQTMAHCEAKFSDLFGPIKSPNVKVTEVPRNTLRETDKAKYGRYNSLAEIPNSVYCEGYCVNYKGKMAPGCQPCPWNRTAPVYKSKSNAVVFGCGFCTYEGNAFSDVALLHHGMCAEGLKMYSPPAHVIAEINRRNISKHDTAGVHIRTGDKLSHTTAAKYREEKEKEKEEPTWCAKLRKLEDIASYYESGMRTLMKKDPAIKKFVVASDNKQIVRMLQGKFGEKKVIQFSSVSNSPSGCAKTLALDLWALASTKAIIGSYTSTFGYLAAALRESKPVMYIESCSGKLTPGRYADEIIDNGEGRDDLASHFHTRVFCSSGGAGCHHSTRRRLSDIRAEFPQRYLDGGLVPADAQFLL